MDRNTFFPPLSTIGVDALSIGIEYLQEHLIGDMFDSQVRRPLRVPTCALTCVKISGSPNKLLPDVLLLISRLHGTSGREQGNVRGYIFPRLQIKLSDFLPGPLLWAQAFSEL
jgi:hypothetical protein